MNKKNYDLNEEAEENNILDENDHGNTSSEGEGDDLMENLDKDYKKIDHLDKYEEEGIDDEEMYSEMDEEERKEAERKLDEKDKKNRILSSRIPAALLREYDENSEDEELRKNMRNKHMRFIENQEREDEIIQVENFIDQYNTKGNLEDWLKQRQTQKMIIKSFDNFIKAYKNENENDNIYEKKIIQMCEQNKQTLEINYTHLVSYDSQLATWVLFHPQILIPIFDKVAFNLTIEVAPNYGHIHNEIFIRFKDLPLTESLRFLRYHHLNHLIQIRGVITKRTSIIPQMKRIFFYCEKCGEKKGPLIFNGNEDLQIGNCQICGSKGPFKIEFDSTIYKNFQKITIQESPGLVPPGRIPRYKEVILINDLVDSVRPGDEVEIVGIYIFRYELSVNIKYSFPVFNTYIEANSIKRINDFEADELTDDDKIEIKKLGNKKNIAELIFKSIAPSIFGHKFIKKSLAMSMFGGVAKDVNEKHKIRGDINVLIVGDPGLAKSQFLKYIQKVFYRSVYTTGKGASAVGLTAGVHKDPISKEWVLEGGALVLADKGICLIDEFDKMNDKDRTSIHEAMEQQSISISKAGIVTSLLARCSVIAAANPIRGRYNERENFLNNVDLTEPILSRFDLLCVVKDEIDIEVDYSLSTFVINSHINSHPEKDSFQDDILLIDEVKDKSLKLETTKEGLNNEILTQEQLKKYIMYVRKNIHPQITNIQKTKLSDFYSEMRKEFDSIGGVHVATRHLESIVRMTEAHAKMHLRQYIREDDLNFAIKMMLESMLMSMKYSTAKALKKKFSKYLVETRDQTELLMHTLSRVIKEHMSYNKVLLKMEEIPEIIEIKQDTFEREAKDIGIYNFDTFYQSNIFKSKNRIENRMIIHKYN